MYPGYKARRKEFRDLFGSNNSNKFVVDYSCAYHKDILHQGRVYVTTSSCCFYSYIFGWENKLTIPWSDVVNITKEKTAIFIPNAIQITTADSKYFFASFVDRESSFMMLHKLWQAVASNKTLSDEDVDQIIACEYGEGDENDNIDNEEDMSKEADDDTSEKVSSTSNSANSGQGKLAQWMRGTEGKVVIDKTFSRPASELLRLLYTNDNFYFNFQKERGTTELDIGDWEAGDAGSKVREVCYNMELNNPVGPKKCHVKESQVLKDVFGDKKMFSVDTVADNSGVPYADSFSVLTYNCLLDTGPGSSRLIAKAEIKFKKELWGFLKDKIETNAWSGIKNYYSSLSACIESYSESEPQHASLQPKPKIKTIDFPSTKTSLLQPWMLAFIIMVMLATSVVNIVIFYRLSLLSVDKSPPVMSPKFDLPEPLQLPQDQSGWLELVSKQSDLHYSRTQQLRQQLVTAAHHIAAAEAALDQIRQSLEEWKPFDWLDKCAGNICDNKKNSDENFKDIKTEL